MSASSHGDRSASNPSTHARDDKSDGTSDARSTDASRSGSSSRGDASSEAVRCLISCVEQLVREIPRGAAARFEGVTEEIRKARKSLEGATTASSLSAPSVRTEGSKTIPTTPRGGDGATGGGSSRSGHSDDVRPSATPPMKSGL